MGIKKIIALLAVATFFYACNDPLDLDEVKRSTTDEIITNSTVIFDPSGFVPDPGKTGPYKVCTQEYSLYRPSDPGDDGGKGIIYYPSETESSCAVKSGGLPLVVFVHATGPGYNYTKYKNLLSHLASWGFAVMAYNRNNVAGQTGVERFTKHLLYTYTQSVVKNHLTADIALVGHSSGGGTVRAVLPTAEIQQLNLKSVVLLSPAFNDYVEGLDISEHTNHLLTINVSDDQDPSANGGNKVVNKPMKTGVLDYDLFSIKNSTFSKDALFVSKYGHYYQDYKFCLAYVNAFLLQHLKGQWQYNKYFKNQEKPADWNYLGFEGAEIIQLHREGSSLIINDFENGAPNISSANIKRYVRTSYLFDQHSPHNTGFLEVEWNTAALGVNPYLQLSIHPDYQWTANYKYLAFDVSQMYEDPVNNGINFYVGIRNTDNKAYYQQIEHHKEPLNYPFQFLATTKTHMRTYLIPLTAFQIDTDKLEAVIFRFLDPDHKSGHVVIDNIRFMK
ncbi:hypothetical protein C900_05016 [Fulvivirga imtechensis AK7]|uniref:Serine aminopeptidase S33 domain-containing protein n=1 Tax=Fulvivirga imtechensis AK7 TaxID=1237149 RepID=L8JPP4_9BACT|nr:alpha/beta hydrolase [Fulvivirga imtechensis]ELR69484.1 hypothetical protein C900_05016 [Fulvivirga imtechensis AK7]